MSSTSRACRARGIWRTTRHTDERAALYTTADRRPTNQVSAWQAERESRPTRRHLREDVGVSGVSARMSREFYDELASMEFCLTALSRQTAAIYVVAEITSFTTTLNLLAVVSCSARLVVYRSVQYHQSLKNLIRITHCNLCHSHIH